MRKEAQLVEAMLFASGDAVSKKELQQNLGTSVKAFESIIEELCKALEGHGLTLVVTDAYVQLTTSSHVSSDLAQFLTGDDAALSKTASETLAIIAYRGPISRYDIDVLRGVDSRRMVRKLLHRGMIRQIQRQGKTMLYDITEEFLTHVGIDRREQLPKYEELSDDDRIRAVLEQEE